MKKAILITFVGALMVLQAPVAVSADKVLSLRGDHALDMESEAIVKKAQLKVDGGIKRNWKLQPPSIPHDISKESISLKGNTCMKCHSKEKHKQEKAPEIGESHYKDAKGKVLKKPSSRRWFCNQCHAPQKDVKPLVENTF